MIPPYYLPAAASVAQQDVRLTDDQEVTGSIPAGYGNIDHVIFSKVILSHLQIQEGQLSVSGKTMCTSTS